MVTETEKQERLLRVFNIMIYGLAKGLWDLFGEASFSTTNAIGDEVLEILEKELDMTVEGNSPEAILNEINRVLIQEIGTMEAGRVELAGQEIHMACEKCVLRDATMDLEDADVQPFACLPMTLATATMRKRLGTRSRLLGRVWNPQTETCTIKFEIMR